MKTLVPMAVVLLALACRGAAQDAPKPPPPELPVIAADELVLEYLTVPDGVDHDVLSSLMRLHRRQFRVENGDGSVRGPLDNCQESDQGFLLYDTAAYVKGVKDALAKVLGQAPHVQSQALRTEVYMPHFVEVDRLGDLLRPLRRVVTTRSASGRGWDQNENISCQDSPALIVLNDTPEQVARMLDLLARVDQPPPQMLITCWLVVASSDNLGLHAVPQELADNLKRVLPYGYYGLLTTGLLRTSILAGTERSLSGTYGQGNDFQLLLRPGAVDGTGHRLAFERIEFQGSEGQHFDTSAVLDFEDYTVLGAAGSEPLLVVLQVKPVQG